METHHCKTILGARVYYSGSPYELMVIPVKGVRSHVWLQWVVSEATAWRWDLLLEEKLKKYSIYKY